MTTTVPAEPRLRAVLLKATDRLGLPLTQQQVRALAVVVAPNLPVPRPVDDEPKPEVVSIPAGPTPEQLDALAAKARSRALTPAEADRLAAGIAALRAVADRRGAPYRRDPLEVWCPACKAVPGAACTSSGGGRYRAHRARLRACV